MKRKKYIWQKAFSLSFAFHLIVILTVGAMAASFHEEIQRPQEQLITVNLADTPEEIAKAQEEQLSPFSKFKNLLEEPASTSKPKASEESNAENKSQSTENTSQSVSNLNDNSQTSTAGEISSPDGILPASSIGGGSTESTSDSTGGGSEIGSGGGEATGASQSGGGSEGSGGNAQTESAGSVASRFSRAVDSNKSYPYAAKRLNQQGTVGVYVALDSDGNLISAYVTSSVNSNLDNAAMNAVRNSCPFPHDHGSTVEMNINVNFYLN